MGRGRETLDCHGEGVPFCLASMMPPTGGPRRNRWGTLTTPEPAPQPVVQWCLPAACAIAAELPYPSLPDVNSFAACGSRRSCRAKAVRSDARPDRMPQACLKPRRRAPAPERPDRLLRVHVVHPGRDRRLRQVDHP